MSPTGETQTLSHSELVRLAARWLRGTLRCRVVLTEMVTAYPETPDAVGWDARGNCTLIECKTTNKDFIADQQKPFRRESYLGIGSRRYYLTRPGVIVADELPPGWGLLYAHSDRRVDLIVDLPTPRLLPFGQRSELSKLLSFVRRAQLRGFDGRQFPGEVRISIRRRRRRVRR